MDQLARDHYGILLYRRHGIQVRVLPGGAPSYFSLTLLIVVGLAWILFFVVDALARDKVDGEKNKELVVSLLTMTGTVLAVFTLLGTFFFAYIAPRVH